MSSTDAIVIGSGPSSVICAQILVEKNIHTLMLDYGIEIEKNKKKIIDELSLVDKQEWKAKHRDRLHNGNNIKYSGVPLKLSFGSAFPYINAVEKLKLKLQKIENFPSLAKGGLSNVWGGSILPYRENEFNNWPIKLDDLEDYYKYVIGKINISCFNDDLKKFFPIYSNQSIFEINKSSQAKYLGKVYEKNRNILNENGIFFGYSRLAINQKKHECIYCGSCLYGCVHSLIYNSGDVLKELKNNKFFKYKNGLLVEKFIEKNNKVTVICRKENGKEDEFETNRVYIGAGFLSTAKIIFNSYSANLQKRKIKAIDSQYFFLPALMFSSSKNILSEKLHTLSQCFLEINNKKISKSWSHIQIYTFNDFITYFFKKRFKLIYPLIKNFLEKYLFGRIIFLQGYLHSDLSSTAELNIEKIDEDNYLSAKKVENYSTKKYIYKIINLLKKNSTNLGFYPISFFLKIGNFGRGSHSGGTFKMSANNDELGKSDKWGRPFGFKKVHIIDSSILPTIPATTITLTVMANAARIANNHNNYES